VFLSSNWAKQTNFTFVNVLTQIGLGYPLLYLMAGRRFWVQLLVAVAVLVGYGAWFAYDRTSPSEEQLVRQYVHDQKGPEKAPQEFDQFTGRAAAWNKHLNPAADVDRVFLNLFPRDKEKEPAWQGRQFWINDGGYQTLNFVPSFVTMLFGLMTGQLLRGPRSDRSKLVWILGAGLACFVISMGLDTKMWPVQIAGCDWNFCPIVKRIWTPTWTLYSTGWTLWMLAGFYALVDMAKVRAWAFPFVVVGMNSIAMYVAAQLLKPWLKQTARIHLSTLDALWHDTLAPRTISSWQDASIVKWLYDSMWSDLRISVLVLAMLWLICLWLYRQRIFVRI
jgi:predicted acyltransferase